MDENVKEIAAGEFKSRCLRLLDEVAETGAPLIVTKRGVPVAKLVPVKAPARPSLRGSVVAETDLISPVGEDWDADR
jgi:prevent-host-death family protein